MHALQLHLHLQFAARSVWYVLTHAILSEQDRLSQFPQLSHIKGEGAQLLQLARSTPYVICALVGHKTPAHVDENLELTQVRHSCVCLAACTSYSSLEPKLCYTYVH